MMKPITAWERRPMICERYIKIVLFVIMSVEIYHGGFWAKIIHYEGAAKCSRHVKQAINPSIRLIVR
jgi:hypothetical protein